GQWKNFAVFCHFCAAMPASVLHSFQEIALAIRVGVPHLERVAQGIREYAHHHTEWRFLISPETHDLPPASLEGWKGQGVIALCNTVEEEDVLEGLHCPVVNISGALESTRFPRVRNDYQAIGRKAAKFLRTRGFRRFGFYGVADVWYSQQIETGFGQEIRDQGFDPAILRSPSSLRGIQRWNHGQDELEKWLRGLSPPFAILAAHDPRATMVIRACERIGLRVPEDVAVMGVNEDTVTCETSRPTLTSLERNGKTVGWRIAETLHQLIQGEAVEAERVVPPGEVYERESTQTLAVDHPGLVLVVESIRAHYQQPLSVEHLAAVAGKSRRWLEEIFREELNASPAVFLERVRVEEARKRLEEDPSIALGFLATECGFSGTRQLNMAFQRIHHCRPREFVGEVGAATIQLPQGKLS
ncbi:MAG: substrate-binding domain-containing protein, partial [Verrucomicrobiota bacterium]